MKRFVFLSAFWTVTSVATGQEYRINVPRPAYDYEVIQAATAEKLDAADRDKLSGFLLERQGAIERARTAPCPEFLNGKISVAEFAERLDRAIETMHVQIAAAYQQMAGRLSSSGKSELQRAIADLPAWSAQTRAVDIVVAAPRAAKESFTDMCNGAVPDKPHPSLPAPGAFSSRE
jgi:hypothetical protein